MLSRLFHRVKVPYVGETIAFDVVKGIVVLVTATKPKGKEWHDYCRFIKKKRGTIRCFTVFDAGGAPNTSQRIEVMQCLESPPYMAVFTNSSMSRVVTKAFSKELDTTRIRYFRSSDMSQALSEFLGLSKTERILVALQRMELQKKLHVQ